MKNYRAVVILLYLNASLLSCIPSTKKSETTKKARRTGEVIAPDYLIGKYEREHQKLYQENIKDGNHLKWPALQHKHLSNYCRRYLQQSVPNRTTNNVIGIEIRKTLCYEKENSNVTSVVIIVQCKVKTSRTLCYYITRAPELNCVYALKCTGIKQKFIYTIIHKYCDFEDKPIRYEPLRQERMRIIDKLHRETGQPIAKGEYLLAYELEHQKFFRREGVKGRGTEWPHIMVHCNLDSYCHQFLGKCVPRRNRKGVTGRMKTVKLRYHKLYTNKLINVAAVQCLTNKVDRQRYHMTRAPEINCVYALLRQGYREDSPLIIIFKHCDFEVPIDQQPIKEEHHDIPDNNVIPKTEVKEEASIAMQQLQLFPNN